MQNQNVILAAKIHSLDALATLSHINGLAIQEFTSYEEITRRAIPLEDKTLDHEYWRCRSSVGFLAPQEDFLDLLRSDWQTVAEMKTTHIKIAENLDKIIQAVKDERKSKALGISVPMSVNYLPHDLFLDPSLQVAEQSLVVYTDFFLGYQQSIFYNKDHPEEESSEWNLDYTLLNPTINKKVKIAGDGKLNGTTSYIYNYGFYEGGAAIGNSYRADPKDIVSILTGKIY